MAGWRDAAVSLVLWLVLPSCTSGDPHLLGVNSQGRAVGPPAPSAERPRAIQVATPALLAPLHEADLTNFLYPPRPPRDIPEELVYLWRLRRVRYKDRRPSFVPKHHPYIRFYREGRADWFGGCNHHTARIHAWDGGISFEAAFSTALGCGHTQQLEQLEVQFGQVTRWKVSGTELLLETGQQLYELQRFPYSRLSMNGWRLHSVEEKATQLEWVWDRYTAGAEQLRLELEEDARFRFTDRDRVEYTGTLRLDGNEIGAMDWDAASWDVLLNHPARCARLRDSRTGELTAKSWPTTVAPELHWPSVTHFEIEDGVVLEGDIRSTAVLRFHSPTHVYRFHF